VTKARSNDLSDALAAEVRAIQMAIGAIAQPTPEFQKLQASRDRARDRLAKLQREVDDYLDQDKRAVEAYNQARRQLVVDWALGQLLGYCSKGEHFAPLNDLEGLITSGAYVTSGYYEHLRGFEKRATVCDECRRGLRSGPGRYEGEYTTHHTHELKYPAASLELVPTGRELNQLATKAGLVLPSEARWNDTMAYNGCTIAIGDLKLTTTRFRV
jgi:hypothetical protein